MGDTPTIEDRLEWTLKDNVAKAIRIEELEAQNKTLRLYYDDYCKKNGRLINDHTPPDNEK